MTLCVLIRDAEPQWNRRLIVPTLCVGMPVLTLCVLFRDAEPQ